MGDRSVDSTISILTAFVRHTRRMPDSFLRTKAKELFGTELPPMGEYAVGNIFFPPGSDTKSVMSDCKAIMERLVKERGLKTIGWRPVPVDNSMLGKDPLDSEPITEQIFINVIGGSSAKDKKVFEQDLLLIRKMAEEEATDTPKQIHEHAHNNTD